MNTNVNVNDGWGSSFTHPQESIAPTTNPMARFDAMDRDQVLMHWQGLQKALAEAKEAEIEFRKYVVKRAFPNAHEGMNNQDLGKGYTLKAGVKFNYKLDAPNDKIEACLDRIAKIGNNGNVISERLIRWEPHFLLTEYRLLQEEKDTSNDAKEILKIIGEILVITDAAPTLSIIEPKNKK